MRVVPEDELEGLDLAVHGERAYDDGWTPLRLR
jgi:ammonia channel protein AmtB